MFSSETDIRWHFSNLQFLLKGKCYLRFLPNSTRRVHFFVLEGTKKVQPSLTLVLSIHWRANVWLPFIVSVSDIFIKSEKVPSSFSCIRSVIILHELILQQCPQQSTKVKSFLWLKKSNGGYCFGWLPGQSIFYVYFFYFHLCLSFLIEDR